MRDRLKEGKKGEEKILQNNLKNSFAVGTAFMSRLLLANLALEPLVDILGSLGFQEGGGTAESSKFQIGAVGLCDSLDGFVDGSGMAGELDGIEFLARFGFSHILGGHNDSLLSGTDIHGLLVNQTVGTE